MALTSLISLDQAYIRGLSLYEIELNNWGNRGAAQDANSGSVQSPLFSRPILGAAIAPTSTVHGCIIRRNLVPNPPIVISPGSVLGTDVVLYRGAPTIMPITAPFQILALQDSFFSDTYVQEAGAGATFGTALPSTVFAAPVLRVLVLLDSSAVIAASPRADINIVTTHTFAGAGEELVRALPVHGRRRARVTVQAQAGVTADLRVTGIVNGWTTNSVPPPDALTRNKEFEIATGNVVAGAATATETFLVDPLECQWLLLKATRTVGANGLNYTMTASD